jgi:hypothetical protein
VDEERRDLHAALAAPRTAREVDPGEPLEQDGDRFGRGGGGRWLAEEVTASRQADAPGAIGEQAEMADAHKAARHNVQEEASEELVGLEGHHLDTIVIRGPSSGNVLDDRLANPYCAALWTGLAMWRFRSGT